MPVRNSCTALLTIIGLLLCTPTASAQYFGQNKPRYERFDWKTYQTPHFEIYNYLGDSVRVDWIGKLSEEWYGMHQNVLRDTLPQRNLMLLYSDHADFQQTNAISGSISAGTGGVTEAFKNRVIYPFAMSNHQTDHVLGHELVHAFQYDIIINGDSTNLRNLSNLPLWMVEGLAEYLSIGRVDAHTSMWMRDAVLNDDVPTMKKLNNPKYFPYRWGQAWWAFLTGMQGDQIIRPLFESTAKIGLERAVREELHMSLDELSDLWVQAIKREYQPYVDARDSLGVPGKLLIDDRRGGNLNIAPQVSPDGRYVIYLSEKNLFSIDLFLADARTGEVIRQVTQKTRAGHIDDFAYVESAGTWSPNSKQFAFVGVSKGRNVLLVNEVEKGKTVAEYELDGVQAFDNPTWSPDGKTIVVAGLVEGQVDLYAFDLESEKITQLTDSWASELLPSWDARGERLVFAQDHSPAADSARLGASTGFDIATLDLASGAVKTVDVFPGADNLNPGFDSGGDIVFVSNADGYRDMYRYAPATDSLFRLTRAVTGVSGITAYAPAISVSPRRDRIAYTYLNDGKYEIYSAKGRDFLNEPVVDDQSVDLDPATLPTLNKKVPLRVDNSLRDRPYLPNPELATVTPDTGFGGSQLDYSYVELRNPFKLDFIGGGVGVGTNVGNPSLGTQAGGAGGVQALFSDVLGNRQIFAAGSLNGQIYDFGAQLAYIDREHTLGYGFSLGHQPYQTGAFNPQGRLDTVPGTTFEALRYDLLERRIFEDRLGGFVDYPFSRTTRVEAGASFARYSFRDDRVALYYDPVGRLLAQDRNRDRESAPDGFTLGSVSTALVGDNSSFGLASPLQGYRYRLGVARYFGDYNYTETTVDGRVYQRFAPVTLAARFVHYGRYGLDRDNQLAYPFYVGNMQYVRGLNGNGAFGELAAQNDFNFNALTGNKLAVANFEVRMPFTGPKKLGLINFPYLYTELTAFVDAGLAYDSFADVRSYYRLKDGNAEGVTPSAGSDFASLSRPVVTAGVSLRANVLGALVVEPYYARVVNMEGGSWRFGLNLVPGW